MKVKLNQGHEFEVETPSVNKVILTLEQVETEIQRTEVAIDEAQKAIDGVAERLANATTHKEELEDIKKEMKKLL